MQMYIYSYKTDLNIIQYICKRRLAQLLKLVAPICCISNSCAGCQAVLLQLFFNSGPSKTSEKQLKKLLSTFPAFKRFKSVKIMTISALLLSRSRNGRPGHVWFQATQYQREVLHPHIHSHATFVDLLPAESKKQLVYIYASNFY